MTMMMIGLVMTMMVMMISLVRGQFVHCQLPPPPVNKTGATALPHMGIGMSLRADDDDGYLFILMQQMQRTAMKAPRKTRQAMVRTATFCWSSLGLWQSVSLWSLWIWQSSRSPQPIRGPQPPQVVPERLLEHQGWSVAGALVASIVPGGGLLQLVVKISAFFGSFSLHGVKLEGLFGGGRLELAWTIFLMQAALHFLKGGLQLSGTLPIAQTISMLQKF